MPQYYRTQEVVVGYVHHYRCGCTCPPGKSWDKGWVSANSNSQNDRSWEGKQHFQLEKKGPSCLKYLKYARSEARKANQQVLIPQTDDDWGLHRLKDLASKTADQTVKVVAVMWCNTTAQWYIGKSGQGVNAHAMNQHAPAALAAAIGSPEVDVKEDAYGWNCAEIACVLEAYKNGRVANDLTGCKFFASRVGTGNRELSACKTCRVWIRALKGKYGSWEGGKYQGLV